MVNFLYKDISITSNLNIYFFESSNTTYWVFSGIFNKNLLLPLNFIYLIGLFYVLFLINQLFSKKLVSFFSLFSEKELNSIDDLVIVLSIVFGFFSMYIFYFLGFFVSNSIYIISLAYLTLNIVLISLILVTMMYNFNYFMIIFINGAGGSLSILYEFVLDTVNLLSFNLRLSVQLVRIIILFGVYYMLSMIFYEVSHVYSPSLGISGFFQTYARLLFEVAHTLVIFVMQVGAFMFMVFWLFQFLMTCFSAIYHEKPSFKL